MEHFYIFCDHLVYFVAPLLYFMVIWYVLWSFNILSPFWYIVSKIWQPCTEASVFKVAFYSFVLPSKCLAEKNCEKKNLLSDPQLPAILLV
jgi:hypothetical protein